MLNSLYRVFAGFLVPGGLVFAASIGFLRPDGLPFSVQEPVSALPFIVLAFGLVFGWYLASARMILALLLLALTDRGLNLVTGEPYSTVNAQAFVAVTASLLPLNFLAFSLFKEDTVSTVRGLGRIGFVCLQPFLVLWISYPEQQELAAGFQHNIFPWLKSAWTPIPQPALIAFAVAGTIHAARFMLHRDPWEAGSFWALAAVFLAYHCDQFGWKPTNYFSTAGLLLFLALVQSSHQRAYQDDLTGIAGRLAYEVAVGRLGKQYSVAVMAVDQQKNYASMHGKSVGEQVLKHIAPRIQAACDGGRVFRICGEEFTLLFPNHSATETLVTLEAMRKAVEKTSLVLRGRDRVWEDTRGTASVRFSNHRLPVTVSIGVAEVLDESSPLDQAIKAAYHALYEAKGTGGNVVKRGFIAMARAQCAYKGDGPLSSGAKTIRR